MPRTKRLNHYPPKYFDIVEGAALGDTPLEVELPSRTDAVRLRGHFYAFVGSLRAQALEEEAGGLAPSRVQELAALSHQVLVQVVNQPDGRAKLVFTGRERSWQAQAIAGLKPATSPAQDEPKPSAALLALMEAQKGERE